MFIDLVLTSATWFLAIGNMLMIAWAYDGPAFAAAMVVVTVIAAASAWLFAKLLGVMRVEIKGADNVSRPVFAKPYRLAYHLMLFSWVLAPSWLIIPPMPWWGTAVEVVPPAPPPIPVAADPAPFVPVGPERLPYVPANVMDLITAARRELTARSLDVASCAGAGVGDMACRGDYLIAVTDMRGAIQYVTVYEGKTPSVPGYKVELGKNGRATGVNPDIVVNHPPGTTVLAIKTAIDWAGTATWAVYVPYSEEINTPEVRAAGVAYLWSQVEKAREDLRKAGVRSQFFEEPGQENVKKKDRVKRLVADVIPADHVFTLVLTENVTHPEPFTVGGSNARRLELLNEALAQLGANQSKAWDYRASSVGARGKGQFMPKTYAALCKAYGIDCPAHADGARDDNLAFRLMFLHADDEWRGIKNRDWLRGQPMLMRLYLAGGYNGFYGNAAKAIRTCGVTGWRLATCAKPLPLETRSYLDKYEWIYGQHSDAKSHDAVAAEVYPNATVETTPDAEAPDDETKTE